MNMLPNGEIVSNDEAEYKGMLPLIDKEEKSREEYIIDDQVGLGPVVWRVFTTQFKDNEAQCDNIFYTRYLIKDNVFSLIINEGSSINVASTLMIKKLELATSDHPQNYMLHWLNSNSEIHVSK